MNEDYKKRLFAALAKNFQYELVDNIYLKVTEPVTGYACYLRQDHIAEDAQKLATAFDAGDYFAQQYAKKLQGDETIPCAKDLLRQATSLKKWMYGLARILTDVPEYINSKKVVIQMTVTADLTADEYGEVKKKSFMGEAILRRKLFLKHEYQFCGAVDVLSNSKNPSDDEWPVTKKISFDL